MNATPGGSRKGKQRNTRSTFGQDAQKLRDTADRLRLATRAARVGIWDFDCVNNRLVWDDAMYRLYGITADQFKGAYEAWQAGVHPGDRARTSEEVQQALRGEREFDTEFRVLWPDGSVHHIKGIGTVQRDASGRPLRMLGTNWDITERKRTEEALRESESKHRALIEMTRTGFVIVDREGRVTDANEVYVALSGHRHLEEILGRSVLEWTVESERERNRYEIEQCAETACVRTLEISYVDRVGRITPIEINATAIDTAQGKRILALCRDISRRKQEEQQMKTLSRAVEQSPASIVITDAAGGIEYVNPKFTELTGYKMDEVRGQNPRILKSSTSATDYANLWQAILRGETWRGEFHNRKKSGETFWESASISAIIDEDGQLTHFVAVKEDITERRRLEAQLRQSQKLEAVGQLAGGVAHDFNNILAAMMMQLGLLQQQPGTTSEVNEALTELLSYTKRAANLTTQLLLFSRRSVMQPQPLNVNDAVQGILKMLRRLIGEQIHLSWKGGDDHLPAVIADPGMVDQVIMNLVVNARDAMPTGGRITISTASVEIGADQIAVNPECREGRFVRITVSDTGCGMDQTVLKRIFEPFFTTKETGKGSGLGLATVYGIVKQHRGWITVESEIGKGSSFSVLFPAEEGRATGPTPASSDGPSVVKRSETILLVEDEPSVRKGYCSVLRVLGHNVIEAADGVEALTLWEDHQSKVALLLTDMVMPNGLSGLQLARQLLAAKPELKVVVTSGYSPELVLENGFTRNIIFLPKPCSSERLAEAVQRALN
jgi:PAS domain S-box-containing protein